VDYVIGQDVGAYVAAGNEAVAVFKDGSNGGGAEEQDDLLLELDRALDELEKEQRTDHIRDLAAPAWDRSEIFSPSSEQMYRQLIDEFMGRRSRDLPRSDHSRRRRMPARDPDLSELLGASMARARSSLDRRRAKVWVCSGSRKT
jgi:hypothetical protein